MKIPQPPDFISLGHTDSDDDLKALYDLAIDFANFGTAGGEIIEVGSWVGLTALVMAQACPERIFCVDSFQGKPPNREAKTGEFGDRLYAIAEQIGGSSVVFETFCHNVGERLYSQIFPLIGHSLTHAKVWPRKVDMIFLDADHDYESVRDDIKAWAPHVKSGGILCGHDYGPTFPGVQDAVHEAFGSKVKRAGDSLWWVRITS